MNYFIKQKVPKVIEVFYLMNYIDKVTCKSMKLFYMHNIFLYLILENNITCSYHHNITN